MAALKEIIKQLIHEVEQMVDNDECDLNPDQIEEIALIVHEPKFYGREEAAKFLGVSLERIDETTAPYVIYGTVAKVEVQCAIVG